jgi:quercetin dioxygenase-like cupin family protein
MKKIALAFFIFTLAIWTLLLEITPTLAEPLKPNPDVEVVHPGEGKTVMLGKIPVLFKTIADKGKPGQVSITESTIKPQEGAPLHKHPPETFYVIEGDFGFYAGQPDGTLKTLKARTGDLVNVPAGIPHAPKNVGKKPGKLLTITGSDWFQNFIADVTKQAAGEASEFGVPTVETMAPIGKKYGIQFVKLSPKT